MPKLLIALLKALKGLLASSFGLAVDAKKHQAKVRGTEVKNQILENEIKRGDQTENILAETMEKNDEGLPSFDYSKYHK